VKSYDFARLIAQSQKVFSKLKGNFPDNSGKYFIFLDFFLKKLESSLPMKFINHLFAILSKLAITNMNRDWKKIRQIGNDNFVY